MDLRRVWSLGSAPMWVLTFPAWPGALGLSPVSSLLLQSPALALLFGRSLRPQHPSSTASEASAQSWRQAPLERWGMEFPRQL